MSSGLSYPPSVKIVRVGCLSRIHAGLMLQALDLGADGVMLLGCEPGKCHFGSNHNCVTREYEKAQDILELLGMDKGRLTLLRLPAFEGHKFVTKVLKFGDEVKQLSTSGSLKEVGIESALPQ